MIIITTIIVVITAIIVVRNAIKRIENPPVSISYYPPQEISAKKYAGDLNRSMMTRGYVKDSRITWTNVRGSLPYGQIYDGREEEDLYLDFLKFFVGADRGYASCDSSFFLVSYLLLPSHKDDWVNKRYKLKFDSEKMNDFQEYYYTMIDTYFEESIIVIRNSQSELWKSDLTDEEKLKISQDLTKQYCQKIMKPIVWNYIKKYVENYNLEKNYYSNLNPDKLIDIELSIFERNELNQ